MSASRVIYAILLLLVLLYSGWARSSASQSSAASALFQQFETVFYSKADLLLGSGSYGDLSKTDANALRVPFAYLLGALDSLGKGTSADVLANTEAVLVGAKDFRPPAGLGGVHSQSCYVLSLRRNSEFDFRKYLQQSAPASAAGKLVWNWSAKLGEFGEKDPRPSSLYATQVAKQYALVCNDSAELGALTERLSSPDRDSQEPSRSGIRDWASVSQHDVWGYRRYRHTGIANRDAAGMTNVTPGAEALIFFLFPPKKAAVLELVNSPTDQRTASNMNAAARLPPLRSTSSGVWETTIQLSGNQETSERMVAMMWLFGFGLYL
jgi:hypothetical protein